MASESASTSDNAGTPVAPEPTTEGKRVNPERPTTPATPSTAPAPRRRKRRWWLRIPLILILFILVLAALVQVLLWSDIPRQIAEQQVGQMLNVRAKIGGVSITWLGHTQVHDVTITMPLEDRPIATIKHIDIRHTALPLLPLAINIDQMEVEGAHLYLREDEAGVWNAQKLLASLPRPAADSSGSGYEIGLPNAYVNDATATVTRADGRSAELTGITAKAEKATPKVYTFAANVGSNITASGNATLTGDLQHNVDIEVVKLPKVARLFSDKLPDPLTATVNWSGHISNDRLTGEVRLDQAEVDAYTAKGQLKVVADLAGSQKVVVTPQRLTVSLGGAEPVRVQIVGGEVSLTNNVLGFADVRGKVNSDGTFGIDGQADIKTLQTDIKAAWERVEYAGLSTTGNSKVKVTRQLNGQLAGSATVNGDLSTAAGRAEGAIKLTATGVDLQSLSVNLESQPVTYSPKDGGPVIIPAISGLIETDGTTVRLVQLAPTDNAVAKMRTFAEFNYATNVWWVSADIDSLRLPVLTANGVKEPVNLNLRADGNAIRANLRNSYLSSGPVTAWVGGTYTYLEPEPCDLTAVATYSHTARVDDPAQVGTMKATAAVTGKLSPLKLVAKGKVDANDLVIAGRRVGDIDIGIESATLTDDMAHVASSDIQLLGADWTLNIDWDRKKKLDPLAVVTWKNIDVANVASLAGQKDVTGTIDTGRLTIEIPSTEVDDARLKLVAVGSNITRGPIRIDKLEVEGTLKNGELYIKPVVYNGNGQIVSELNLNLAPLSPIHLHSTIDQWPAPNVVQKGKMADLTAAASGEIDATYSIKNGSLTGLIDLHGQIDRKGDSIGTFAVDATATEDLFTLKNATINVFNGTAVASGTVPLKDYNQTRLDAKFDRFDAAGVTWINPKILTDFTGLFSGELHVAPSTGSRPLDKERLTFTLRPQDARWREVEIGNIDLTAFWSIDSLKTFRFVTETADVHVAGGTVKPFARVSNTDGRGITQLVTLKLIDLQLQQLAKSAEIDGNNIVGKIGGNVKVFGLARNLQTLSAAATISLTESQIADFKPMRVLYATIGQRPNEAKGTGELVFRLEQGLLTLTSANYYNSPVDARAYGSVERIDLIPKSPISMVLVGSLNPFKDSKLSIFKDFGDSVAAFQETGTTIRVGGVLGKITAVPALLSEFGEDTAKILLGK